MGIRSLLALAIGLSILAGVVYMVATEDVRRSDAAAASISWQFIDSGYDEARYADRTAVTLTVDGTVYDVGTYDGSCWILGEGTAPLLAGQVAGVQCWFAGAGDEVGLFEDDGELVVRHGELQEPQGDGTPDFRGNFRDLFHIPR